MARKIHLGYGALLIVAFLLTIVALFTPGWRSYKGEGAPDLGLVTRYCGDGNRQVGEYDCRDWHRFQLPFEQTTLAFMIIALLFETISVGCFFGLFNPRARLGLPAFSTTTLAFISLLIAISVYGARMQHKTAYMQSTTFELLANVYLGYSYWIAVVSTILLFIASGLSGGLINPVEAVDHRMN